MNQCFPSKSHAFEPTLICGAGDISKLFNVFHDGVVNHDEIDGANLTLFVDIAYLAQRVQPHFRRFRVALRGTRKLVFTTWPKSSEAPPALLTDPAAIFTPPLAILGGESDGEQVNVICNQPAAKSEHCGGTLAFSAESALVTDEAGKAWSLTELEQLAAGYWHDWHGRTTATRDSAAD